MNHSRDNYKTSKIYENIILNGTIKARCINNYNPLTSKTEEDLIIGKEYEVEYALVGRSHSIIGLIEFPQKEFNAILFELSVNGESFDLIEDVNNVKEYLGTNGLSFNNFFFYKGIASERIEEIKSKYFNENNHPSWYAFVDRIKISRELQRLLDIEEKVNNKVDEILKIKSKEMSAFLGNARYRLFWEEKKRILKEEYGIDWLTPKERSSIRR